MIHRHLAYPPDTPAAELPSAAIVDLLERGDLLAWQPVATAMARDPHGPLAGRVARLIDAYPMYGTSVLWRAWLERCRARGDAERRTRALDGPACGLAALRRHQGLTQVELARKMGMSQSDLSKLERRRDVRVSTLRAYARALGGELRMVWRSAAGDAVATITTGGAD